MNLNSIESLIQHAPHKDDGFFPNSSDVLGIANESEQIQLREMVDEIRESTITPKVFLSDHEGDIIKLKESDGFILRELAISKPWQDISLLVRSVASACISEGGNYMIEESGEPDIERRLAILSRLKFLSKGLKIIGENRIGYMSRSVKQPKEQEGQYHDVPADNAIRYITAQDRERALSGSIRKIDIITRAIPERGAEARVQLRVIGSAKGNVPVQCGISFDQGIKDFSYRKKAN
jgi:hypothetical protein